MFQSSASMLWNLKSNYAEKYFKAWNIQSRLAWDVPFDTHTYLVEGYLCEGFISLRNQVLGRYSKFLTKLFSSPSKEIVFLVNLVYQDARSVTCSNIRYISMKTNVNILATAHWKVKMLLPVQTVPEREMYRIGLLNVLFEAKFMKDFSSLNLDVLTCKALIDSLCKT